MTLSADASAHSLGAVILQEGKPIDFAAKSLTECNGILKSKKSCWP